MSTDGWSKGYPVSDTYPPSWHSFQSPAYLRVVCAIMGAAWEVGPDSPMNILEVGCGTGYTALMLAAGNPNAQVIGLDYNPAHIAEARSLAAEAGLKNARFIEADLAELSAADLRELPEFDLVTVHGVWSWVGDPVRQGIVRLLRERLKAGGLVMMGYNALPGAAGSLGLAQVARRAILAAGGGEAGIAAAMKAVDRLVAVEPAHLPSSGWRRLLTGEVKGARYGYLLHEFQTEFWRPTFHSDVAAALGEARCEYVGSASIDENFPTMSLNPKQQALWEEAGDVASRELVFDLCVPRAFRRDVFVRGLRRVPRDAVVEGLWFAAATHAQGQVKLRTQAGEAELPEQMVRSVRTALAERPCTIATLRGLPGCDSANPSEMVALLMGSGVAVPLWRRPGSGATWEADVATARRLNAAAARRFAPHGVGAGSYGLATPAMAGGMVATPMELAVAALAAQAGSPLRGPQDVMAVVEQLLPSGDRPQQQFLDDARALVEEILSERLNAWRALGIA
jgi:SAM-dependent methyltransferase